MLQPFAFEPTPRQESEQRNWKVLDEASKTFVRNDLVMSSPVSDPVISAGYFTLYGPIVFYNIQVTLDTNDGWTGSTSYITMPFSQLTHNGANLAQHTGQAVGAYGTVLRSVVWFSNAAPTRLFFTTSYTNGTGATEEVFISGWYYRN